MTLILSFAMRDAVVQVSDRRLTFPDGSLHDDNANKATVFDGRMVFAYSGLARLPGGRTDQWLTGILATPPIQSSLSEAV